MNACANSRHLQNRWKSCEHYFATWAGGLWSTFCRNKISKNSMLRNFKILSWMCWQLAASGPPKYWRLIWKLWNLRSSTLGSEIWGSGDQRDRSWPGHPSSLARWSRNAFVDIRLQFVAFHFAHFSNQRVNCSLLSLLLEVCWLRLRLRLRLRKAISCHLLPGKYEVPGTW